MSPTVAGVDVGGSHVTAAAVDLARCAIVPGSRGRAPVRSDCSAEELVDALASAASAVSRVDGWGVALPGPFDYDRGIALYRGVAKFDALYGVDLRAALARRLRVPGDCIRFLNDAHAFCLGELLAGAGRGSRRCIGITLGTGVGSAFMAEGQRVGDGPEVPTEGRIDLVTWGGRPVEETVSRRALLRAYAATGPAEVDVETIAQRARAGDERARRVFTEAFVALGEALAPWVRAFRADRVVVGGAIARAWDLIEPRLRVGLGPAAEPLSLVPAALAEAAPLIGAALHASTNC